MVQARTSAKEFFNADERLADLGLIAVPGAEELTAKIDRHLLRWAQEAGMDQDTFIIESECPRFSSGDGKGLIRSTVRGDDIYFVVDVGNYNQKYKIFGHENFMSPDDHFQNLKRLIQATSGKAKRMSVIMPLLYGSRQHRRAYRESLDCAVALQELQAMGISNIVTFDAHDPRMQNAVPLMGFDNVMPTYQVLKAMLRAVPDLQLDRDHFMVISPDEGAMNRNMYYASVLGVNLGMFYKRRDYSHLRHFHKRPGFLRQSLCRRHDRGRVRLQPYLPHSGAAEPPLVPRGGRIQVYRLFHRRAEPRPFRQRHHRSPRKDQGSARTHRTGPLSIFLRFYRKARCFYSGPLVFRRFSALDQRSVVKSGLWGYNQDKIKTARQSRRAGRNRMDARYTGEQIAAARRAKGLTQKQLADALGVTDKAVSKWERGLNYPDIVLFQPISELLELPLLQLFCKDGLSAEQAVAAAAALSAQEKQAVRRDMKWHAVFRLAAALTLSAALVYVSRVLDLHGIYGWPQGCTMGMLPFTGWLAGDAVFTLRQIKKL